jgi:hypothetical protein
MTTTTTTTVKATGQGQATLADLIQFVTDANTAGISGETPVKLEQERHYDADAREMAYDDWTLSITGEWSREDS